MCYFIISVDLNSFQYLGCYNKVIKVAYDILLFIIVYYTFQVYGINLRPFSEIFLNIAIHIKNVSNI